MTFYQFLIIKKKEIFFIKILLFGFLLNVLFSIILIKYFSITGIAISNFLSNLFIYISLNKSINFFYFRNKTLKHLIFYFIKFLTIFIILNLFPFKESSTNYLNFLYNLFYFLIMLFITEVFSPNKYKGLTIYYNFVTLLKKI